MFKVILHKSISASMALIVLCSTLSFTIEKHFCGDFLIDSAVFSEVKRCGDESELDSTKTIAKKPCCKDTVDVIEGQDELLYPSFNDLDLQDQLALTVYTYSYINLFESLPQHTIPHKNYRPPKLVFDIQSLDEVYLI
ncbi:hypothetical protein RM697_11230 [Ichthyenterobacterium sp. W332]|uniref:Secreted protein n=1 Tax=Microcosmobacter mediterraneus TaxID=3075607 RepID=A0ABU2YMW3_9FLAO|nr:hypothetical protein [Ichthyenterobacterium sp. W332]MDT0559226.1 hypothetical protein [Ichthyenterobacterium sp. W332]